MKTTKSALLGILLIGMIVSNAQAQNLIQNPSFEQGTPAYSTAIVPASWPSLRGLWEFNNSASPLTSTVGPNLTLNGTHTTIAGHSGGDNAVRIGVGSNYRVTHGIAANGGGSYVNRYSILVDFRISAYGNWKSIYQTNQTNSNDAEIFVRDSDGMIGVAAVGYGAEGALPNVWHRLIISVNNGSFFNLYLDGRLIRSGTIQAVDGRFSLDPSIYFMSDDSGDDGLIDVSTIALFDKGLSQAEVESLGKWTCNNWLSNGNFQQQFRNGGFATAFAGTYYLFAGSDASSDSYQDVDVSAYAAEIDAGTASFTFSGKIQTYLQSPQDQGRIVVEYRNAGGTVLSSYNTANQSTSSVWANFSNTQTAPALTRTVRIRMLHTRNNGTSNDAYYDDFSLTKLIPLGADTIDLEPVSATNQGNLLRWNYEGNAEPELFEVAKSTDCIEWEQVAVVSYSGENSSYAFIDEQTGNGLVYYRIVGIRPTTSPIYSSIRSFKKNGITDQLELLFENPVQTNVPFFISTTQSGCDFIIRNTEGKLVASVASSETLVNQFKLEVAGVYFITVKNGEQVITKKLLVY
ncbi:MAG: T9SS type A sorting domain-containing protein [Fluviicola sp.]|nr:T9SS type A sorting domain-containing protein [Fluviicola sp.]